MTWTKFFHNFNYVDVPNFGKCATPEVFKFVPGESNIALLFKVAKAFPSVKKPKCDGYFFYMSFDYWASSSYPFCYRGIAIYTVDSNSVFTKVWSSYGGFNNGGNGWQHVELELPHEQRELHIVYRGSDIDNCENY